MRAFRTSQPLGALGRFRGVFQPFPGLSRAFGFPGLFRAFRGFSGPSAFRGFSGPFVRFSSFPFLLSPASSVSSTSRVLPGLVYAFPFLSLPGSFGFLGFPGLLWAFSSSRASRGFRLVPPFAFFSGFFFSFPSVAALVVLPRFLARLIFLQGGHGISTVSGPRKGL